MNRILCKSIAEGLGTTAIVLFGCGTVSVASTFYKPELLDWVPVIFGLTVAFMVYATGHLSGAHFNPAVTIAFAVVKRFPWREVPIYCFAQCVGGMLGCFLLWLFVPEISTFAATVPKIPVFRALAVEITLTFFLMFVIKAVATDNRAEGMMAGAAIGFTIMVDAFFAGSLTGASMNPARSLGPAIFEGALEDLWIYVAGPIVGACLGAIVYRSIRCDDPTASKNDVKGCC